MGAYDAGGLSGEAGCPALVLRTGITPLAQDGEDAADRLGLARGHVAALEHADVGDAASFKLPPLRIVLLLAVIHETLAHLRYIDVMALVAPFFIARPLAQHLSHYQPNDLSMTASTRRRSIALAVALLGLTFFVVKMIEFRPAWTPSAALEKIKEAKSGRIFNDYPFGGYLIYRGIPPFIDLRAELYGPAFLTRYARAIRLEDLADFVRLLDEYKIDTTLLFPSTQAVGLLDRLPEWDRIYADDVAVVHVRRTHPENADSLK